MAAASATQPDEASKARLMAHMNKDHQLDMQYILQYFNKQPLLVASDYPRMTDIDLDSMTLQTGSDTTHRVKLVPPMASWDDRRQRLIDMTMAARAGLRIPSDDHDHGSNSSDNKTSNTNKHATTTPVVPASALQAYPPPRGLDYAVLVLVATLTALFGLVCAGQMERGTTTWQLLETATGPGVEFDPAALRLTVSALFGFTSSVHALEMLWLERTRLRAHGIARGSPAWWRWMVGCLVEGVMAIRRFDATVEAAAGKQVKKQE